jgi:hypothetical protein
VAVLHEGPVDSPSQGCPGVNRPPLQREGGRAMADGVDVAFAGGVSPEQKGVQVKLDDRGLWIKDKETWMFFPWHRISKVSGFPQPLN